MTFEIHLNGGAVHGDEGCACPRPRWEHKATGVWAWEGWWEPRRAESVAQSVSRAPLWKSFFLHFLQYAVKESIIQILQCLGQQNLVIRSQLHGKSIVRKWTETSRTINSPCDQLALRPAGEGYCPNLRQHRPAALVRKTCVWLAWGTNM